MVTATYSTRHILSMLDGESDDNFEGYSDQEEFIENQRYSDVQGDSNEIGECEDEMEEENEENVYEIEEVYDNESNEEMEVKNEDSTGSPSLLSPPSPGSFNSAAKELLRIYEKQKSSRFFFIS